MTSVDAPYFEITPNYDLLIRMTDVDYNEQNPSFIFPADQYADLSGDSGDMESRLRDPEPLALTEPLVLSGFLDALPSFDYLPVQFTLPVMSRRMLDVLNSVSPITAQALPVRILDNADPDVLFNERTFADDARTVGHRYNDDYVMLRLVQRFDMTEMTPATRTNADPDTPALPAIFRQRGTAGIFVTATARAALMAAGMKGCDFEVPPPFRASSAP